MDFSIVTEVINNISGWMKHSINEIVLSMVATLLVIYGNSLLLFIKQQIGSLKLFLRITLFVAFCAFGFTFLTAIVTPYLSEQLARIDSLWLPFIIVATYYLIGLSAQRKGLL
ncbi:MAG: DUF3392 family protein [Gammaproteobacteria bacterium]|nr:DUF3392 family protein [Gammaproteobacteria bacterium]